MGIGAGALATAAVIAATDVTAGYAFSGRGLSPQLHAQSSDQPIPWVDTKAPAQHNVDRSGR